MPLITFDSPVNRISGRYNGANNTYTFNNGQPVIRLQGPVDNPQTTDQTAIRAAFSATTKRWPLITQSQRDAWTAWAKSHKVTNRLGKDVSRNGLSAFVELNSMHYIKTGSILDSAPVLAEPAQPSLVTLPAAQSGTDNITINVTHTYTTLTGLFLVVRATPSIPFESQTPAISDYRMIRGVNTNSIVALQATGTDYSFNPTRYTYTDGNFAGIEVTIMNAEGWQSIPTRTFEQYLV